MCEKVPSLFSTFRFASHCARGFRTASKSLALAPFAELPLPADIFGVPSFVESSVEIIRRIRDAAYFLGEGQAAERRCRRRKKCILVPDQAIELKCRCNDNRGDSHSKDRFRQEEAMLKRLMGTSNDVALTMLRGVLGLLFFAHGSQKMLGWFGGFGFHGTMEAFAHMGVPGPIALLIICTEFFAGLRLIV